MIPFQPPTFLLLKLCLNLIIFFLVKINPGVWGIPFTILALQLINAFNMIDGHDGFAAISVLTTIGAMALTDISMLITSRVMLFGGHYCVFTF